MIFNSLPFLVFLPTVLLLYYLLPAKRRWILLLLSSYFFYGFWKVEYLGIIVISTLVDFFVARYIHASDHKIKKNIGLAISLCTNLGLLFFFKYSGWIANDVLSVFGWQAPEALNDILKVTLPVGISFYTFQTLSYTIDVYFGKVTPEKNPFKLALFVSFFPQLVAGPIERFSNLQPQLFQSHPFKYNNLKHGARLILYGLFIKMCVADNVAPIVDTVFNEQGEASSLQLFNAMLLFGLQIYSDFHGYSLIAIGSARLLGIGLMDNFNSPYHSLSIREFWTRWHISLSTWFRDYVFIPLGGSRVSMFRWALNIMLVFAVSGLWHGANWTFVVWGALHGGAYLVERYAKIESLTSNYFIPLRWALTMSVVFIAWIYFRSDNIELANQYITRMFAGESASLLLGWDPILITFIGLFILSDLVFKAGNIHDWLESKSALVRWSTYSFLLYSVMAHSGTINHPFIYFQF